METGRQLDDGYIQSRATLILARISLAQGHPSAAKERLQAMLPLAYEDDPQRAVLCGLEISKGIHAFQAQIQREHQLDFNVRVGIHTGLVVVGAVGGEREGEYAAFGDAVKLAARMEQTTQPSTVQISAQTYQLVKQVFDCERIGKIRVKRVNPFDRCA